MKIELTRAEVERILLEYANSMVQNQLFNEVESNSYREIPDTITISKTEPKE